MVVRLEFTSAFEMLDFVQIVTEHVGRIIGLDDDTRHYVGVAIRESVINAIKHGNRNDPDKHVFVEFSTGNSAGYPVEPRDPGSPGKPGSAEDRADDILTVRVRDQGEGFDPSVVADPLAPENLLKPSGRGIFLIRSFMDDVHLHGAPGGGMEIRMVKRVP